MERVARLRELLKQKEAIDTELAAIKKQMNEESGLFKKPRKPRAMAVYSDITISFNGRVLTDVESISYVRKSRGTKGDVMA